MHYKCHPKPVISMRDRKDTILFLLLAFTLPLPCLFLEKYCGFFQSGTPGFILFGIQVMTPTLAALIMAAVRGGVRTVLAFLKKCYIENCKLGWMLLSGLLAFTVLTAAKLTAMGILGQDEGMAGIDSGKWIIILWALIAEEAGWRGYLQERLGKQYGHSITPLITGIVWGLWHYHLFLLGTMSVPFLLLLAGCITDSYGYYWVTLLSKGNILPAAIWHFTGNLFISLFLINPEYNQGSLLPYLLFIFYSGAMAIGISIWGKFVLKRESTLNYP